MKVRRNPSIAPDVIRKVLLNLQASVEQNGAIITWDSLPTVHAHEIRLVQLLQNLVGNAIKYRSKERRDSHRRRTPRKRLAVFGSGQRHRNRARICAANLRNLQALAWTKLSRNRHRTGNLPEDRGEVWRPHLGGIQTRRRFPILLYASARDGRPAAAVRIDPRGFRCRPIATDTAKYRLTPAGAVECSMADSRNPEPQLPSHLRLVRGLLRRLNYHLTSANQAHIRRAFRS